MSLSFYKDTPLNRKLNRVGQSYTRGRNNAFRLNNQIGGVKTPADFSLKLLLHNWAFQIPWFRNEKGEIVRLNNEDDFRRELRFLLVRNLNLLDGMDQYLQQYPELAAEISAILNTFYQRPPKIHRDTNGY
jgi:hypothetical protein